MDILTPFKTATDLTQGENILTASLILPVIRGLRNEITKLESKNKAILVA